MPRTPSGAIGSSPKKPRRDKGDGSLRQRQDGRWEGTLSSIAPDGTRQRHSVYAATRAEAKALLDTERARQQRGLPPTDARRTVAQFLVDTWLPRRQATWRPSTYQNRCWIVTDYLVPGLGGHRLSRLAPLDILTWLDTLTAPSRTRQECFAVLHTALQDAWHWQLRADNPAASVPRPRHTKQAGQALTPDQARTLLAAATGTRWDGIIRTALYTAMRQGEILALRWRDVDFRAREIHVTATLEPHSRTRAPTKTARSERTIPLVEALRGPLRTLLQAEREADRGQAEDYCFCLPNSKPYRARHVYREFRRLLAAQGLPAIRFHDLRGTAITFLLKEGVPVPVVMALAGHTLVATTLRYTHINSAGEHTALARLAGVLDTGQFSGIGGQIDGQTGDGGMEETPNTPDSRRVGMTGTAGYEPVALPLGHAALDGSTPTEPPPAGEPPAPDPPMDGQIGGQPGS